MFTKYLFSSLHYKHQTVLATYLIIYNNGNNCFCFSILHLQHLHHQIFILIKVDTFIYLMPIVWPSF